MKILIFCLIILNSYAGRVEEEKKQIQLFWSKLSQTNIEEATSNSLVKEKIVSDFKQDIEVTPSLNQPDIYYINPVKAGKKSSHTYQLKREKNGELKIIEYFGGH